MYIYNTIYRSMPNVVRILHVFASIIENISAYTADRMLIYTYAYTCIYVLSGSLMQTLGIQKVVPCPDIPEASASPCNIIHCEPINLNCKSKLYLESPLAECDVDYLLKAKVHRMLFPGQKGYWPSASPVTSSPSPEQRESRLFSTSRQPS